MRNSDILYLKEIDFISTIVFKEKMTKIYSVSSEISKLSKAHFFNIKEYRKIVRKKLDLKNKIPIYFSQSLLLFYVKSKKSLFWINYFAILKICYNKNVYVFFNNGSFIEIEVSKRVFLNELKKIKIVLEYINNL